MAKLLDGKKVAEEILQQLKEKVAALGRQPALAIILCGNDPASRLYTSLKQKRSLEIGLLAQAHHFPENISKEELKNKIQEIQSTVDGIIVQLPLPLLLGKEGEREDILNTINPEKDVDGLTAASLGKVLQGEETLAPATPKGIVRLLEHHQLPLKGREVIIINHSALIGKPLAAMLLNRGATVSVCHEFTRELPTHTLPADIVITAVGKAGLITASMIKAGAVVIDAGISKIRDNKGVEKIVGDVVFEEVKEKASFITPVPGGVGPMTIALLLENLVHKCGFK